MSDNQIIDEENQVSIEKRKRETEGLEEAKKQKTKVKRYVPWKYLTKDVLLQCCTAGTLFAPVGKAGMLPIFFDYKKFAKICPECPTIVSLNKMLVTKHPMLKSAFGYSPYVDKDGKVSNQLRFSFEDFVSEKAKKFQEHVTNEWNTFFPQFIFNNLSKFKERYLEIRLGLKKGEEVTLVEIEKRFKSIIREPEQSGFSDYIQFKLTTEKGVKATTHTPEIQEDPYKATINVWAYDADPMKRTKITSKLTLENSVDYEGDIDETKGQGPIFTKGMYAEGIITFKHINFRTSDIGLTMGSNTILIANKNQLYDEGTENVECPF